MNQKKVLVMFLILLLSMSIVKAIGVGSPIPNPLNIAPGQRATFFFSVDGDPTESECQISFQNNPPFDIEFYTSQKTYTSNEKILLPGGKTTAIYGEVTVPTEATSGQYRNTFCVTCSPPISQGGASAVTGQACGIPLQINIGSNPTGQIAFEQKPTNKESLSTVALIGAIIIILLGIILIYSALKKGKSKKK